MIEKRGVEEALKDEKIESEVQKEIERLRNLDPAKSTENPLENFEKQESENQR